MRWLRRFSCSSRISYKYHSKTSQNHEGCFDFRGLVGFHTKTIQERVKIEKIASIPFSSRISYQNQSRTSQNWKDCFDSRGLVGFLRRTIQKEIKIGKVCSIIVVKCYFVQKPFKNKSKLKRLLPFRWSSRVSYKHHSKTGQNSEGCFDLRRLVLFHTKTMRKQV